MEHNNGHDGHHRAHRRFTREEGLAAIARLERQQEEWQERHRKAQRAADELSARQFASHSADRTVHVFVDGDGRLADLRIDRRRAPASSEDLAAAVIAAVQAARQDQERATQETTREVLGFDVADLADAAGSSAPATDPVVTGNAKADAMFGDLHAFRVGSRQAAAAAAGATATAQSTNKLVSATCTTREITELRVDAGLVHPRRLSMAEQSITEAIRNAHAAAVREHAEQLGSVSIFGLSLGELIDGRRDPADLVAQLNNAITNIRNKPQREN